MLTVSHRILISLEDQGMLGEEDLRSFGKPRVVYGALGQLEASAKIKKSNRGGKRTFRLTPLGQRFIDQTLNEIHRTKQGAQQWYLVLFDIPEKRRGLRAKIRALLTACGYSQLQASVWLGTRALNAKIEQFALKYNLVKRIQYFEVSRWVQGSEVAGKIWDLERIALDYRQFIRAASTFFVAPEVSDIRLRSKELIFWYALIASNDPRLQKQYLPVQWPASNAAILYERLRPMARATNGQTETA